MGGCRARRTAVGAVRRSAIRTVEPSWCVPSSATWRSRARDCGRVVAGRHLGHHAVSMSPLCKALPERVTPELEYLQVKWAAYFPYRQATALLKEVLPLDKGVSFSGTRQRIRAVAKELDAEVERDIANQPKVVADVPVSESANVASVSVDSAWLNHHSSPKSRQACARRSSAPVALVAAIHPRTPREHRCRASHICRPCSPRVRVCAQGSAVGGSATGSVSLPKRCRAQRASDRDQR